MKHLTDSEFDEFLNAYLTTAVWSSLTESDEPLDRYFSADDFSETAKAQAREDCLAFLSSGGEYIARAIADGTVTYGPDFGPWGRAGHDFWLTRNHHGAGFWDGDWPEPEADALTERAHAAGECYVYEENNELHFQ